MGIFVKKFLFSFLVPAAYIINKIDLIWNIYGNWNDPVNFDFKKSFF